MKNMYVIIVLMLTVSFLLIPLLATEPTDSNVSTYDGTSNYNDKANINPSELEDLKEIRLYLTDKETILKLTKEEYILGTVAAEMSAENDLEALKAQALAAYTFAYRKHLQNSKTKCEYDLTNDYTLDQRYIDEDERKLKWGEEFLKNEEKLKEAINAVSNQLILYKGEPILAVYHAISFGKTETAKNVWGSDYPYLQSVNSAVDLLCPDFYSEVTVSTDEFKRKLTELGAEVDVDVEAEGIIGEYKKSPSGTVLNIELCGKIFTGAQIREAFDLRSEAFDIIFNNNSFIFTVSGYGHGVGMSQFGANYMAQQGSDYKEIISTYYKDVVITNIS